MIKRTLLTVVTMAIILNVSARGDAMMMRGKAKRPAASEFGLGPRTSEGGRYVATLESTTPLRTSKMLAMRVVVHDRDGRAVDQAQIAIGGGMPQHGHGLPTRPRVTSGLGNGVYEIEGVRFNMGGWWEFTLGIAGPDGTETVIFNLDL